MSWSESCRLIEVRHKRIGQAGRANEMKVDVRLNGYWWLRVLECACSGGQLQVCPLIRHKPSTTQSEIEIVGQASRAETTARQCYAHSVRNSEADDDVCCRRNQTTVVDRLAPLFALDVCANCRIPFLVSPCDSLLPRTLVRRSIVSSATDLPPFLIFSFLNF